jgi:hypothetical protein
MRIRALCLFFAVALFPVTSWAQDDDANACRPHPQHTVADFAVPVTGLRLSGDRTAPSVIATIKSSFGIKTIVRYYDHNPESIECKTLLPDETSALIRAGFSIAVVFQHNSGSPQTFLDRARGKRDATRALELAEANGQPFGSTIYFGVDGPEAALLRMKEEWRLAGGKPMSDARKAELIKEQLVIQRYERFLQYHREHFPSVEAIDKASMLPHVKFYFQEINEVFKALPPKQAFKIGAYGSGLTCRELLRTRLVDKCWLAAAIRWPESKDFRDERVNGAPRWSLLQRVPTKCPGWRNLRSSKTVEFDLNQVNPAMPDFGQWSTVRAGTRQVARPQKCPAL